MAWRPRSGGMIPLMLLQAVNQYRRLQRKPPITAALLAANTLLYIRPAFLHHILPPIQDVWFNPHLIIKHRDLKRFLLSGLYHLSESHLVYNMMSLLWKGIQLENSLGSAEFASMVAALLGLSQTITLLLAKSLVLFGYDRAYYHEYSVGFSGVLFAMKVVLNNSQSVVDSYYTNVHGFVIPAKHAAWAELILIQLLVPGVSFLGHLGGILAGILYLRLKKAALTSLLASCWPLRSRPQRGGVGRRTSTAGMWRCQACTFDNSGWLTVCEICGAGRSDDGLSLDEIRQRRIQSGTELKGYLN
ncbi:hypothetical protein L6452_18883 [Arctium lappa]|uniref:Uncharacterized protein n=1 Tax=Arctium lappa TaxID=4217 RepID=A0ACB9C7F7_ARCLA|nr:hypothetical protein L6452_18883 [Arctium lappa]